MANAYCKEHSGSSPRYECEACQEVIADLRSRPFPLLDHVGHISWSLADEAYPAYSEDGGRGQTIERLAQRGGFSPGEMDEYRPGWRPVEQEISALKEALSQATQILLVIPPNDHQYDCNMRVGDGDESCSCHCKLLHKFLAQQ